MLSRVAESVYWMNRYVERAENVARFIDVNYNLNLGNPEESLRDQWAPLVYTTGDQEMFEDLSFEPNRENVLRFLAIEERNPNSILSCLIQARENARTIREAISSSMWEELNKFYHMVRASALDSATLDQPNDFCTRVKLASHLLSGVTDDTMSHNESWHFGRMGRLLERADKTSRIVDVQYFLLLPQPADIGSALDLVRWSALLKSASALAMYRRQHGRITPLKVADFLLLDRAFPRSVRFCLMHAHESLQEITGSATHTFVNRAEQQMGRLRSELDYTSITDVIERGLHEIIDGFQVNLNRIGVSIHSDFFSTKAPDAVPVPAVQSLQRQSQGGSGLFPSS